MNAFYRAVFLHVLKRVVQFILLAPCFLQVSSTTAVAQTCGYVTGDGCANTDYSNSFINSTNNAATIEYDNWVSTFHSTMVRRSDGQFMVWGEMMANDGTSSVLTPQLLNRINYPALGSNKVLKVTGGSSNINNVQFIALADNGLYVWGQEGRVIDNTLTISTVFRKQSIGGNPTGLPPGVAPNQVKMMTAVTGSLCIVTCSGDLWMLSQSAEMRGNGSAGNATTWYRVTTSAPGNPFISNIVAVRVQSNAAIALRSDNTIWTWGPRTYLGNGTALASRDRAVQMTAPLGQQIKMIGITYESISNAPSYYLLINNGNLYSLGKNIYRQLGDWTTTDRLSWIQPRYNSASGPVINDIVWISSNENDGTWGSAINAVTSNRSVYAFGASSFFMLGTSSNPANPSTPNFLSGFDDIVAVETGGHTTMIQRCATANLGYVGHWVNGSMGNGSAADLSQASYTFTNTPVISICGANMFALASPDPSVIPAYNAVNIYSTIQRIRILRNPTTGGTLSVVSGPGVLGAGDTLRFTGPGTVVLQYSVVNPVCGGLSTTQISIQAMTGVLPLRLTDFKASMVNCKTVLSWQTDLEQNAERFEVEQSETGTGGWQQSGLVWAQNSLQGSSYTLSIAAGNEPVMFYRLKMVDKDGSYSYSNVITAVNNCNSDATGFRVLPNPAGGGSSTVNILIYGRYRGAAGIILLNSVGAKVATRQVVIAGSLITAELGLKGLSKGTYFVQVVDAKGTPIGTTQKLIKE